MSKTQTQQAAQERIRLGDRTRKKILTLIAASEPEGISTAELVLAANCNGRTVYTRCHELLDQNLITAKTARYGRYHMVKGEYCGFVCSDVVEKAREIRKELDDFARYNPDEAEVVMHNVIGALLGEKVKIKK